MKVSLELRGLVWEWRAPDDETTPGSIFAEEVSPKGIGSAGVLMQNDAVSLKKGAQFMEIFNSYNLSIER